MIPGHGVIPQEKSEMTPRGNNLIYPWWGGDETFWWTILRQRSYPREIKPGGGKVDDT